MSTNAASNREIEADVQSFLDELECGTFRLRVVPDHTRHDDDWWYVVVRPEPPGARSEEYADQLVKAEERFRNERNRNVLLVPTQGLD
ncbi:MAG: hypothetical protein IT450_00425 [Phycisphaerales bacterium]|nr:hypothetical protein [Phycisphaerales bacterium]